MQTCHVINREGLQLLSTSLSSEYVVKFRDALKNAEAAMKCSANLVRLVSAKDFVRHLELFEKFHEFSPTVAAATEFKINRGKLWTETFVDVENPLTQKYPESVIAHEFAHIRECYDRGCILELRFDKHCPTDARIFASVFLMELEEVVADSLLPPLWRNSKNSVILRLAEKCSEIPHPFFLAALKVSCKFGEEEAKLFRKLMSKSVGDWWVNASFKMALPYFRYFYVRRGIRVEDVKVVEAGINRIVEKFFGVKDSCVIWMHKILVSCDND
jgi:hypothetical protein